MDISSVTGTALNVGILILSIIILGGLAIGATWLILRWRRYKQYECRIFERDGFGKLQHYKDDAGIFVDKKTNNKRLFLKKSNVGLSPDNIPYINERGRKIIYLLRTGLKNFMYLNINITNPDVYFTVGEEDVNWAINAYERQKKLFQHTLLIQLLPYIAIAFVSLIILIIFIYFFKEFSTLKDMAVAMKEAAQILKGGTTIIPGGGT